MKAILLEIVIGLLTLNRVMCGIALVALPLVFAAKIGGADIKAALAALVLSGVKAGVDYFVSGLARERVEQMLGK